MAMARRWRRWLRWSLLAGSLAALGAAAVGWLMFQHIPSWYRPAAIAPGDLQAVRDDLARTFDTLSGLLIHEDGPFEYRLTQDQINAWLAAREDIWPGSREWLPPTLSEPFVSLDADGLRLAATYRQGGLQAVVSLRLTARAEREGIIVRLTQVSGGSLGIPRSWVCEHLLALDAGAWPVGKRSRLQLAGDPLPPLSSLFEGIRLPHAWIWENGKQPFRIIDLQFEPGAGVITFEPLPREPSGRLSSPGLPGPAPGAGRNAPPSSEPDGRTIRQSGR